MQDDHTSVPLRSHLRRAQRQGKAALVTLSVDKMSIAAVPVGILAMNRSGGTELQLRLSGEFDSFSAHYHVSLSDCGLGLIRV